MSVPENMLKDAYAYDANGYLDGTTVWQAIDGDFWPVPGTTDVVPWGSGEQDETVFYRFSDGRWTTEKKPACAADLVGVVVSHTSMTSHDIEMRELVKKFSQEEGYREKRGVDLSWSIEKIPEPTQEEKRAQAESQVRGKRDALISQTDYLLTPDYPISAEDLESVKAYRTALRDVPQQGGFPFDVVWPELPSVLKK